MNTIDDVKVNKAKPLILDIQNPRREALLPFAVLVYYTTRKLFFQTSVA